MFIDSFLKQIICTAEKKQLIICQLMAITHQLQTGSEAALTKCLETREAAFVCKSLLRAIKHATLA